MHLIYKDKCVKIPTDQTLVLGRNQLLEITDERISRRQVSVSYNSALEEFQVCLLAPNANVTLNGSPLKPQKQQSVFDQDKLCLYKDSYCVTFVIGSETDTPSDLADLSDGVNDFISENRSDLISDKVSEESSDIYDFEENHT